jgi:hypothetical protein
MSNVVSFGSSNLPVASLSAALRAVKVSDPSSGSVILKMDKTGHWVYGADQTEIEDGSLWAINPFSFVHGFIAWGDGEVLGEKMVPVSSPLPEMDVAPANAKRGWEIQIGMSLKCINGEDEGLEVRFATTSVGGKRSVQELVLKIAEQVDLDQNKPVAVVELKKEHYQHKSYGRIYTPIFDIKKWIGMDGAAEAVPVEEEVAPAAPARRRRSVV